MSPSPRQTAMRDALSAVVRDHDDGMLVRFMVVAEAVTFTGDRQFLAVSSDGCSHWDALGLLDYGRLCIQNEAVSGRDAPGNDEEDSQ
ncbi:hypothetical protein [Embleya sp. NPDC059237]|uniref:hypothetical protein n=1 Tax=Embleya sp. NPDC059237 TaxID=3346784 RepID=UPI00369A86B4